MAVGLDYSDGPIRLHIDYNVLQVDRERFVQAIYELKDIRLRNGAIRWGVFQDVSDPTRLSETFIMESWVYYLRQQERLTSLDAVLISPDSGIGFPASGSCRDGYHLRQATGRYVFQILDSVRPGSARCPEPPAIAILLELCYLPPEPRDTLFTPMAENLTSPSTVRSRTIVRRY